MPGSAVTAIWEGTRPLLVEIQALVDRSHSGYVKRVSVGMDQNRLAIPVGGVEPAWGHRLW